MSQPVDHGSMRIARPKVYQIVAERLMADIVERDLAEGDPLPTEEELSERFGVGRSSVREGLRMLESQGVIAVSGRGHFKVGTRQGSLAHALRTLLLLGGATLAEIHVLRRTVEVEVAGQAAAKHSEADLAAMEAAIAALEGSGEDREGALQADLAFHLALAAASHNGALIAATIGVRDVLQGLIAERVIDAEKAARQHRTIAEAVAAGDAEAARAAVALHMGWIAESLEWQEETT